MEWNHIHTTEELDECLDEQIRETRVHSFRIKVLDPLGNPCPDVSVKALHRKHDFVFGVCPNGHISMANDLACGEGAEAENYWKLIGDLFNGTTLWWGWRVLEPEMGKKTFDTSRCGFGPMERMMERAENLGHRLTAHALLYPRADVSPEWLCRCGGREALKRLTDHVQKTAERCRERIHCFHPVNEAYDEIQQVEKLRLNEGLIYRLISDFAPNARIVNNGGNTIAPDFYEKGIRNAELFGGRVDDLGVRGYFELYDSEALPFFRSIWNHFDNLAARYRKGIRFTEIGAVSEPRKGAYSPWDVDPTTAGLLGIADFEEFRGRQVINEETQEKFLTRMYKLAFAHPALLECTYWDLCDTYTWNRVKGGLIRSDFSPKPAYWALRELIRHTWSTREEMCSDGRGVCAFDGFDGMYEIEAEGRKYCLHFDKTKRENVIVTDGCHTSE